ncbi:MAG: tail fiber domain-containing protein, partial [Candidatus Roizmanbacteria bacterium]|nr:tail fiber domain-containing protein [Candidatus Roizmanbacteria bacterium]
VTTAGALEWSFLTGGQFEGNGASTIQTSTGNLTLATNGGNGHVLLSPNGSGNVGINTNIPGAKLQIVGPDTDNTDILRIVSNPGTRGIFGVRNGVGTNPSFLIGSTGSSETMGLMTSGTEKVRITSTGYVGIGSTAPASPLQVVSNGNTGINIINLTNSDAGTGASNWLQFGNSASADAFIVGIRGGNYTSEGSDAFVWNRRSANLRFATNNAEKMRITSNGNIGIGDLTPDRLLDVKGNVCLDLNADEACTDNTAALSDARLKENVVTLTDSLDAVLKLRGVRFNWNGEYSTGHAASVGFIAQEVEKIFPELVITDTAGYKNLDYGKLTAVLAGGIQEQQTMIQRLATTGDLTLTSTGEVAIAGQTNNYQVTKTSDGSIINKISILANAAIGKLRAGLITTQDFVVTKTASIASLNVTNLTIGGQSIHDYVIALIQSVLQDSSSTLALKSQTSTVSTKLSTFDLTVTHDATVSGTLTVNEIKDTNIQALNAQVNALQTELATIKDTAMTSATNSMKVEQLASINLTVEDTANIHALNVATNATFGNINITSTRISSLADDLNLTALARIVLFDGSLVLAKDGTLTTQGAVIARGGVKTNTIEPADQGGNVGVKISTKSQSPSNNKTENSKFQIQNQDNTEVASIDASGSAYFAQGVNFDKYVASSSALLSPTQTWDTYGQNLPSFVTNGQASGTGILPAGTTEILILNSKVKNGSLIYVTPTGSTDNQVLYMSAKHEKTADTDHSWFKVALDKPLTHDIEFTWWIL